MKFSKNLSNAADSKASDYLQPDGTLLLQPGSAAARIFELVQKEEQEA